MSYLRSILPRCVTAVAAWLVVPGLVLLAGHVSTAGATAAGTANFVLGYGAAATAAANQTGLAGPVTGIASTPDGNGYWTTTATGQVVTEGDAGNFGSVTTPLRAPVVGMASTSDGQGYWLVASDGGVFASATPSSSARPGAWS